MAATGPEGEGVVHGDVATVGATIRAEGGSVAIDIVAFRGRCCCCWEKDEVKPPPRPPQLQQQREHATMKSEEICHVRGRSFRGDLFEEEDESGLRGGLAEMCKPLLLVPCVGAPVNKSTGRRAKRTYSFLGREATRGAAKEKDTDQLSFFLPPPLPWVQFELLPPFRHVPSTSTDCSSSSMVYDIAISNGMNFRELKKRRAMTSTSRGSIPFASTAMGSSTPTNSTTQEVVLKTLASLNPQALTYGLHLSMFLLSRHPL
ncbi:hypothetical protein BHE74_00014475 [Ensete ventricosum]|nr:hypothetical protein GW17_00004685 [Ensete ventricosum]RWW77363.1 hypothetical protein BHE74_00014475 [Ensete ventricosum]